MYLSGIEEVHTSKNVSIVDWRQSGSLHLPVVPRSFETLLDNVALLRASVGEPTAQREDADLQSGRTKVAEDLNVISFTVVMID